MNKVLIYLITIIFCVMFCSTAASAQNIGTWTAYPAYDEIDQIEVAGDIAYATSSGSLFAYNATDASIETFSKMDVLNDCQIEKIKWCPSAKLLMILYENGDIDFLSPNGNVTNLAAYQNHSTALDKTVNTLTPVGNNVMMSTNLGIVVVNAKEAYVVDTYLQGCTVYCTAMLGNNIYAATAEGLLVGNTADNLLDRAEWQTLNSTVYTHIATLGGSLFGVRSGECSLIDTSTGQTKSLFTPYYDDIYINSEVMLICGGNYTSVVFAPNNYYSLHEKHKVLAYISGNDYYADDEDGYLIKIDMQQGQLPSVAKMSAVTPDGPKRPNFGLLKYKQGKLISGTGFNVSVPATVQILKDGEWNVLPDDFESVTGAAYRCSFAIDEDPKESGHIMVGTRSGLYEFRDNQLVNHYSYDNSPLQSASSVTTNQQNNVIVPGLCYDSDGTLWLTNGYSSTTSLFSMDRNGNFTSHHHSEMMTSQGWSMYLLGGMMIDSRGLIWMCNNNHVTPALVCYQPSSDGIVAYKSFVNEDATTVDVHYVRCVAEDNDNNIWVGTDRGPLMLTASDISSGSDIFQQPKIPRDDGTDLADYLLSGEDITAIVVDKANRKWMGSSGGGVYVISPDNMTQLYHFTADNSSLLSDYVEAMAIDSTTGEVYIGTTNGLCSYTSDISVMPDTMNKSTCYAYPNPVEPDFTGSVTICGLSYGADVKIVTSSGELVAEGKSSGGTFQWDCHDRRGNRVASGIYMVETAEADGSAGCVCKIAVVR